MHNYRQARYAEPLIFELGAPGRVGFSLPLIKNGEKAMSQIPPSLRREELDLPELSELEVVRHYTRLSQMNFGIDTGFYPLGSCTMKYNPKVGEAIAQWSPVQSAHPYQPIDTVQGALQVMYELEQALCEIGGVDAVTLQPAAGAQGEFLGMLIAKAHLNDDRRDEVIVPDSAHGTNPASARMAGFGVVETPSNEWGGVDLTALGERLSNRTAALMLTNPNTLGIFERDVTEIAHMVHEAGALLYYDGANLNSILGIARPGDMGFDILHYNLHKTFAAPHGGGGPGSGPVGVKGFLREYLPVPRVEFDGGRYSLSYDHPRSVGKIRSFYGNFIPLLKSYVYMKQMGGDGLRAAAEHAVLGANYMKHRLMERYGVPYNPLRKHEFVLSCEGLTLTAGDVAKRLLDYGFHPPTVYFPHIVPQALMIEPTETEPLETLDAYVDALLEIASHPEVKAPVNTTAAKVDEAGAARYPVLTWQMRDKTNKTEDKTNRTEDKTHRTEDKTNRTEDKTNRTEDKTNRTEK